MRPPIFVFSQNGDMDWHASVEDAESSVESPDVESGEYVAAFDSCGLRLAFEVSEPTKRRRIWFLTVVTPTPVLLKPLETVPSGRHDLERRLREKLHIRDEVSLEDMIAHLTSIPAQG